MRSFFACEVIHIIDILHLSESEKPWLLCSLAKLRYLKKYSSKPLQNGRLGFKIVRKRVHKNVAKIRFNMLISKQTINNNILSIFLSIRFPSDGLSIPSFLHLWLTLTGAQTRNETLLTLIKSTQGLACEKRTHN